MGWRGQDNRDRDEEKRWGELPVRERYDWPGIALTVLIIAITVAFLFRW